MSRIYLDYNATTPILPEALTAAVDALQHVGISTSTHKPGKETRQMIEAAREQVAKLVNGSFEGVIFTSGATEANNLFLKGVKTKRWIISGIEHSSMLKPVPEAELVPVSKDGVIDLNALEDMLKKDASPTLVSIMLVNNETGVIQPVREAAQIAHKYGAIMHTDAVAAAGKIQIDMQELGVDFLTLSGHKMGAPAGAGALVMAGCTQITPQIAGGTQEKRLRSGTLNTSGVVAMGVAADYATKHIADNQRFALLRDKIENEITKTSKEAVIFGAKAPRVANTTFIGLPGITSDVQMMALDLAGIAVSGGASCGSGTIAPSHVLKAMGVPDNLSNAAIRISLGWKTTEAEIDTFIRHWREMYERVKPRLTSAA